MKIRLLFVTILSFLFLAGCASRGKMYELTCDNCTGIRENAKSVVVDTGASRHGRPTSTTIEMRSVDSNGHEQVIMPAKTFAGNDNWKVIGAAALGGSVGQGFRAVADVKAAEEYSKGRSGASIVNILEGSSAFAGSTSGAHAGAQAIADDTGAGSESGGVGTSWATD